MRIGVRGSDFNPRLSTNYLCDLGQAIFSLAQKLHTSHGGHSDQLPQTHSASDDWCNQSVHGIPLVRVIVLMSTS